MLTSVHFTATNTLHLKPSLINCIKQTEITPAQLSLNALFGNALDIEEIEKIGEYYKHQDGWSNRLVQGDSLLIMTSLLEREGMAGKVQTIYFDPPYGIKYGSNWQIKLNNRDVKDGSDDALSGEPEQIKAFRDTWELGIHSYLSYIRDRLLIAKDLLSESGSCFMQISDENVHLVRNLMDEVFGSENFVATITFRKKKMPLGAKYLEYFCDFILMYAKKKENLKFKHLYTYKDVEGDSKWCFVELPSGERRRMTEKEHNNHKLLPEGSRVYLRQLITPAGFNSSGVFPVKIDGKIINPPQGKSWKTSKEGMAKLLMKKKLNYPKMAKL